MKRIYLLTIVFFWASFSINAQNTQTLSLSKKEAEMLFLKQNLELLANHLEISQAEAQLIQAKLWPNPTLSISEINLWSNSSAEELPYLYQKWGKTSQVSAEIEQVIQTGGKRKKNINVQRLTIEGKKLEFESLLKNLKLEFRQMITDLQLQQELQKLYENQLESTSALLKAYNNQLSQGNISKAEYTRLKASEMGYRKELLEIHQQWTETQKDLKIMIHLPAETLLEISDKLEAPEILLSDKSLESWASEAIKIRPDVLVTKNLEEQAIQKHELERAMQIPDVTLSANYDRGGNIMRDFIGLGISFELPIFNTNKGNIKEAQLEIEKSKLEYAQKVNTVSNEITQAFHNYQKAKSLYDQLDIDYEKNLDDLLESYFKNFKQRNTSMLEYLDFVGAYLENKNIILETKKDLNNHFESLQYALGKEL